MHMPNQWPLQTGWREPWLHRLWTAAPSVPWAATGGAVGHAGRAVLGHVVGARLLAAGNPGTPTT